MGKQDLDLLALTAGAPILHSGSIRRATSRAGWGQEEDRRPTKEAGFDAHMVKPVDLAALTTLLAESGAN